MRKKVVIEMFERKYECIIKEDDCFIFIIKVAEIIYPERRYFKGGLFGYRTFYRSIEDFETVEEMITKCVREYRLDEIHKKFQQEKIDTFFK